MKAYGVKIQDHAMDCTATGKYGSSKLLRHCSCGKSHGKRTKDSKARKAKMRQLDSLHLD